MLEDNAVAGNRLPLILPNRCQERMLIFPSINFGCGTFLPDPPPAKVVATLRGGGTGKISGLGGHGRTRPLGAGCSGGRFISEVGSQANKFQHSSDKYGNFSQ
jgi:hypothetical protein